MSSPLTSLSKFRKLPVVLPKNPAAPTNAVPFDDSSASNASQSTKSLGYRYSNEDAQLLNDVTSRMAMDNIKANRSIPDSRIRAPTDLDLLQLSMDRMQKAEADVRYLNSELKDKTQRVAVLEEKVHLYEKALRNQHNESFKVQTLENKCIRLQSIIDRMEDLLIERGLEVIGELNEPDNVNILTFDEADRVESSSPQATTWRPDESVPSILPVNFNCILENIRELNVLAGESEMHFEQQTPTYQQRISTLKRTEPIDLTLYANGIFLFNGPFRLYSDPLTQRFIRDLTDGYFPSELQTRYPEGVPFNVSDKRDVYFNMERKAKAFEGEGHVLQDGRVVNNHQFDELHLPPIPDGAKMESHDQRPKISVDQFLNRIPKSVVKNGQVIDIRQNIEQHLTGKSEAAARCESAISEIDSNVPFSTLRIRSHDGQQTYVIKMKTISTIKDVKQTIARKKKIPFDFDLFAMGTKTFFTDENQTLEQCGLIPNATLGIREVKHAMMK